MNDVSDEVTRRSGTECCATQYTVAKMRKKKLIILSNMTITSVDATLTLACYAIIFHAYGHRVWYYKYNGINIYSNVQAFETRVANCLRIVVAVKFYNILCEQSLVTTIATDRYKNVRFRCISAKVNTIRLLLCYVELLCIVVVWNTTIS